MTADLRDAEFVATVTRERPVLQNTAYLLLDDPRAARQLLDAVLARAYELQVPAPALRTAALRGLAGVDGRLAGPRIQARSFELVDRPSHPPTAPIVELLSRLSREQRIVTVLTHLTLMGDDQIAEVLGRPAEEVAELARLARAELERSDPRLTGGQLAAELRAAVPPDLSITASGFDDLARGRGLIRRRWWRRGLSAVAAAVVLAVGVIQLWPEPQFVPSSAPPITTPVTNLPSTPAPRPRASCDTTTLPCRAAILSAWRTQMADIVGDYVDRDQNYFSGFSFFYDDRYESPQIWTGGPGVLGLELYRLQGGGTQVYLQIATSRQAAVRCGTTTRNSCVSQRFMDGNRFILSETSDVAAGLEVQYSPLGDQVITVIARNVSEGRELPIARSDLISLVQDPRLRLPNF